MNTVSKLATVLGGATAFLIAGTLAAPATPTQPVPAPIVISAVSEPVATFHNDLGLPLWVVPTPGYVAARHLEPGEDLTVAVPAGTAVWFTVREDDGAGDFGTFDRVEVSR